MWFLTIRARTDSHWPRKWRWEKRVSTDLFAFMTEAFVGAPIHFDVHRFVHESCELITMQRTVAKYFPGDFWQTSNRYIRDFMIKMAHLRVLIAHTSSTPKCFFFNGIQMECKILCSNLIKVCRLRVTANFASEFIFFFNSKITHHLCPPPITCSPAFGLSAIGTTWRTFIRTLRWDFGIVAKIDGTRFECDDSIKICKHQYSKMFIKLSRVDDFNHFGCVQSTIAYCIKRPSQFDNSYVPIVDGLFRWICRPDGDSFDRKVHTVVLVVVILIALAAQMKWNSANALPYCSIRAESNWIAIALKMMRLQFYPPKSDMRVLAHTHTMPPYETGFGKCQARTVIQIPGDAQHPTVQRVFLTR